jgi:hypothetical protein
MNVASPAEIGCSKGQPEGTKPGMTGIKQEAFKFGAL